LKERENDIAIVLQSCCGRSSKSRRHDQYYEPEGAANSSWGANARL
jgi:hypothetical protein